MISFNELVVIFEKGTSENPHKTLLVSDGNSDNMKLEEESVFNPRAQFSVEHAPNGTVHIKSCYNNKYWTWVGKKTIKTISKERVDDVSAENCILVKPKFEEDGKVSFIHVQTGNIGDFDGDVKVFNHVNPYTLFKMPKRVAFKGLCNDKFLTVEYKYLTVFNEEDYTALATSNVVRQTKNGDIQVQNWSSKLWWEIRSGNQVTAFQPNVSEADANTLFEVTKTDVDNVIVLRSRGNGLFCGPTISKKLWFAANLSTATKEAHIEVVEPLLWKKVKVHKADFNLVRANTFDINRDTVLIYENVTNRGSRTGWNRLP